MTAKTPTGILRSIRHHWSSLSRPISGLRYLSNPNPHLRQHDWRAQHEAERVRLAAESFRRSLRYQAVPLHDDALASSAADVARAAHPRKKNWEDACPSSMPHQHHTVSDVDNGRYSRGCRYTRWSYRPLYHSVLRVWRSGRTVHLSQSGGAPVRITAPSGLSFRPDGYGVAVVSRDGTEYHPTAEEWRSRAFARTVRQRLSEARTARRAAASLRAEQARHARIKSLGLLSTRVTLDDSRRAGNCVAGTLQFAETRLRMSRADILAAPHLVSVSADRLIKTNDRRAIAAVDAAWARETLVCI